MHEALDREIRLLRDLAGTPRDPLRRGMVTVADLVRRKGDPDLAMEVLAGVRPELVDFAPLHLVEGRILRARGETAEARVSYGRALQLDPENAEALEVLAELATAEGDLDEADRHRETLARLPVWIGTPVGAGSAESTTTDAPGALEDPGIRVHEPMRDPVSDPVSDRGDEPVADPVDPSAFAPDPFAELIPLTETRAIDPAVAAASASPFSAEDPPDPPDAPEPAGSAESDEDDGFAVYTETLAELYARQGSTDRAIEVFERLIDADPANPELRSRLAELRASAEGAAEDVASPAPDPEADPWRAPQAAAAPDLEALAEEMSQRSGAPADELETPFVWEGGSPLQRVRADDDGSSIGEYLAELLAWTPTSAAPPAGIGAAGAIPSEPGPSSVPPRPRRVVPIESLAPDLPQ